MKPVRYLFLAVALIVSIYSVAIYTSCSKDKCNNVVCQHGGACNSGSCVCLTGFEGSKCQTLSRDKFIFTFNGVDSCIIDDTGHYFQYPIYMHAIASNPVEMSMLDLFGNVNDSAICTMRSTDSFSFTGSNNSITYYGSGTLRNDTFKLIYHVQQDTTSYDCRYTGGR